MRLFSYDSYAHPTKKADRVVISYDVFTLCCFTVDEASPYSLVIFTMFNNRTTIRIWAGEQQTPTP